MLSVLRISRIAQDRCKYFRAQKFLRTITSDPTHNRWWNRERQKSENSKTNVPKFLRYCGAFLIAGGSLGVYYYFRSGKSQVYALENIPGVHKDGLKNYTIEEIGKHDNEKDGIWVYYKDGVYDITRFVSQHPGGSGKIMMAAGGSIEPFWLIFANHNIPEIHRLLESMRIGNVDTTGEEQSKEEVYDPYGDEPKRHKALKVNGLKPFCAEPPASMMVESFLTPLDLFYVRNHLPVPRVDPNDYDLEIAIEEDTKKVLNLESIKKYPKYTVTTAIMCGGNRRSEMNAVKPLRGLSWNVGAVGNASWSGARLSDVLSDLGINEDDWAHVQFEGLDLDPSGVPFGASIPIRRALDPKADVILAYEMNGEPLPRDHGFPVRVIVPGVVGVRNVKWLARIIISKEESPSQFQRGDYKSFSPSTDWDTVDFSKAPAIQDMPVTSAICNISPGETVRLKNGKLNVKGYAWSGGGNKIIRVDLTADEGKTWHVAEHIQHDPQAKEGRHWAWSIWSGDIPVDPNASEVEIWAKAVDSSYNVQPESFNNIWNLRGLLSNAYHRVKVKVQT
ncbi:sulfite oxidase [Fopius arisanus]|uniref:Sulfite oxidase n=1 Tax=Fopius arisanus TaxID=64838 RepID=A0A9R1T256_9HYME|nr:PREDICTED: sulfite oxidase [Fopius arisanus]